MTVGVVAIGRNEGQRLRRCLESLTDTQGRRLPTVYVDSGSSDDSVAYARGLGVDVVELDLSIPFTAARARNAGLERLRGVAQDLRLVQFIDGDCELDSGWLPVATTFLDANPEAAVVCGRRRERFPQHTVYNLLCDFDWDGPTGEVKACGGDALMRVDAFLEVSGFRESLIAGEEPELCVRLRQAGWKIVRLPDEMCLHDAAMTRFVQWWRRCMRAGHAYAEGAWLHGGAPERHGVRAVTSSVAWSLLLPLLVAVGTVAGQHWMLLLLLLYPLQVVRLALAGARSPRENWINAVFLVLSKFAEFFGNVGFLIKRLRGGPVRLIEYK